MTDDSTPRHVINFTVKIDDEGYVEVWHGATQVGQRSPLPPAVAALKNAALEAMRKKKLPLNF